MEIQTFFTCTLIYYFCNVSVFHLFSLSECLIGDWAKKGWACHVWGFEVFDGTCWVDGAAFESWGLTELRFLVVT